MRISKWLVALFLGTSISVHAADFIEIENTVTVNAGLEQVWAKVGDFCAIQEWHPAVAKCEAYDDHGSMYRTLTLGDGGKVSEKHGGEEANAYSYYIKKSPFPVKTYKATFMAESDGSGTKITWKARFKSKGASDEEAKATMQGVFDAGIESIKGMF
ncbi:MAG: SRPBCC family protein [Gammaproteobacteria bacterium]